MLRKLVVLLLSGLYTNSFRSPSYNSFIVPSKASPPQITIYCFLFQFPVSFYIKSSTSCLRLLLRCLPVTSINPSIFPSITCFIKQFLRQLWPIQFVFFLVTVCRIFLSSLTLRNTSPFLTRSVQLMFSILLQHNISKLPRYFWPSKVSAFQRHKTLYIKINPKLYDLKFRMCGESS